MEKLFQNNQDEIEKETKMNKDKVDGRQLYDLNEMEDLKNKSDHIKNKIVNKLIEIKNLKININTSPAYEVQTAVRPAVPAKPLTYAQLASQKFAPRGNQGGQQYFGGGQQQQQHSMLKSSSMDSEAFAARGKAVNVNMVKKLRLMQNLIFFYKMNCQ